ncbi:MAG: lysostaphin resistance A-like protein [Haloarculaceae archaeon]
MPRWAAFVGLTAAVVALLLVLARLSQRLVSDGDEASAGSRTDGAGRSRPPGAIGDPRIPRFEPPGRARDHARARDPPALRARDAEFTTLYLLVNVALTQGVFGGILLAGALLLGVPAAAVGVSDAPLAGEMAGVAVGAGLGIVLWIGNELAGALADAAGVGFDESLRELLAPDSPGGWALLLGGVLPTVALVEEFIFRGALIGAVAAGTGVSPWALAVVSALAFGAAHGAQGRVGVAVTGTLGLALAAAFVLTGSLLVVVVAHYLVNAVELTVHEGFGVERLF